jgi:hypothetical protein
MVEWVQWLQHRAFICLRQQKLIAAQAYMLNALNKQKTSFNMAVYAFIQQLVHEKAQKQLITYSERTV